ncbi:MAG: hypothetical protein M1491_09325 [Deltaproteobacteria bacterium]|nr:hypothetical protein [Deltaproteobacteria bacterium]MCL5276455.1 hypothetical protein [Deltaproteobacteria bacterium]
MNINEENGYVLLITLLMLVALTVAGMGAMMVSTSDIQLSGNQRTQFSAKRASLAGVNTGMAQLCSNFPGITNTTVTNVLNTPTSSPQAGFYGGQYTTSMPTVNAGSTYNMMYGSFPFLQNSFPKPITPLGGGMGSAINSFPSGSSIGGGFYAIGPSIGITLGNNTKMECEQVVYYGLP